MASLPVIRRLGLQAMDVDLPVLGPHVDAVGTGGAVDRHHVDQLIARPRPSERSMLAWETDVPSVMRSALRTRFLRPRRVVPDAALARGP